MANKRTELHTLKLHHFFCQLFSLHCVHSFIASETKLVCAVGSRNGTEITKLMVLDFGESLGENQQIKYVNSRILKTPM